MGQETPPAKKPSRIFSIHGGGGKASSTVPPVAPGGPVSAAGAAIKGIRTEPSAPRNVTPPAPSAPEFQKPIDRPVQKVTRKISSGGRR